MSLTRRQFLSRMALGLVAAAASPTLGQWQPRGAAASAARRLQNTHHLAWVWQFSRDGAPDAIRGVLAEHGLGVALKTHDGVKWMSEYDKSPDAVSGPAQMARLVEYFEHAGVPVHAWSVLKGQDPKREAEMSAEVLAAGARSMSLDVEPHQGFWVGTPQQARDFGQELRRRQPDAWVSVSLDPRPWQLTRIPLREFASFSNELAPQYYWDTFNSPTNERYFAQHGTPPGTDGITPTFLLQAINPVLARYGLPVHPMGQGNSNPEKWGTFVEHALANGAEVISAWRFGVTTPSVWRLLGDNPPSPAVTSYVVQPGDTLSVLAARFHTTVPAIMEHNRLPNANMIRVGQVLAIPGKGKSVPQAASPTAPAASPAQSSGSRVYTVQPGDTLSRLAQQWKTSVARIAELNNLANPNNIRVGMELLVP